MLAAQFVLSPPGHERLQVGWRRLGIGTNTDVHHGDQLHVHQAVGADDTAVALIGYALDPDDAGATDADLAKDLAGRAGDRSELLARLGDLGGRHVVVVDGPRGRYAVGDGFGLRQLFFVATPEGVWCASQPRLLEEVLDLPKDPDAAAFAESPEFAAMLPSPGQWWPPYRSIVAGVRHLPPNHLVDLVTGQDTRFWPTRPLAGTDDARCQAELARTLRGNVLAAARRAPLTLLLTGGHDSRLTLAALRPVADDIKTVSIHTSSGRSYDWEVPAKLAAVAGFHHEVVDASTGVPSSQFWDAYSASVTVADPQYAANAEALRPLVRDRLTITGHGAEVGKKVWRQARFARRPTPARLTLDLGMSNHPYVREACAEWLGSLGEGNRYRGDLLYWEQRLGSWAANWALGYDLVWRDAFMPYGSRRLMENLMARRTAPQRFEDPPMWDALIREWWPELTALPYGYVPVGRGNLVQKAKRSLRYLRAR